MTFCLAISTFATGATVFSLTLYSIILEEQLPTTIDMNSAVGNNFSQRLQHAFGLQNKTSIDIILSLILLISLLTMIVSVLLIIGIKKNKPNLVVLYFSFGCLLCLLLLVSSVLALLHRQRSLATITAIIAVIFAERLSAVYSVYEIMIIDDDFKLLLEDNESNVHVPFDNITSN